MRLKKAAVVVCAVLTAAAAGSVTGHSPLPLASVASETPPNIVVIVTDDQPSDSLKAMPFLTSKPGGHWVEFTNAFDATPLCCPSRATILTGLYSHHHGVQQNTGVSFDPSSTIATWLQSAGYRTGLAGKYLNDYPFSDDLTPPPGWSDWFADVGGTHRHYDYDVNDNGTVVHFGQGEQNYHTDVIARRADSFIRSAAPGEPFFLYATPLAPHGPLSAPKRHAKKTFTVERPPNFNEADVSDKPAWIQAKPPITEKGATALDKERLTVYRMVLAVDDLIRTVYQALEDTGTLDNTLIVFMTDNGYMRGEHRQLGKGCVYEECIATPLFVRAPWVDSRVDPKLLSSIDIAPTLASVAGTAPASPVDGTSFAPLLQDPGTSWRSSILLQHQSNDGARPKFWAVRTGEWKYAELDTGEKELYDLVNDPYEMVNRADDPALASIQAQLAADLAALKAAPPHSAGPVVSIGDAQLAEDAGITPMSFPLTMSEPSADPVTVTYSTVEGSATSPEDFQEAGGQATFAPGETTTSVSVSVADDELVEPDETFTVHLSDAVGAAVGDGDGIGTILDDDAAASASIGDVSVAEGSSGTTTAALTVSLSTAAEQPVTVSWATADDTATSPADFTADSSSLTFLPGELSKSVDVSVSGDSIPESDEVFHVDIASSDVAIVDGRGTVTIVDDDVPPSLSISDVTVAETTGDPGVAAFTVTLSAASEAPVSVSYATSDVGAKSPADYEAVAGTLMFAPGETSKIVSVTIVGDSIAERRETFTVSLSAPTGATIADGTGVCTIQDND